MFQELVDVLRELVEPENAEYIRADSTGCYCAYCKTDNALTVPEQHTPDCPITRARNLLTEVDAMAKNVPLPRGTKTIITGG